jgi:hypothetical protein
LSPTTPEHQQWPPHSARLARPPLTSQVTNYGWRIKQDRSAKVVIAGHAFVQNLRRGHYELAVEEPVNQRVAVAFDALALVI